jgi:hypothetical protein
MPMPEGTGVLCSSASSTAATVGLSQKLVPVAVTAWVVGCVVAELVRKHDGAATKRDGFLCIYIPGP